MADRCDRLMRGLSRARRPRAGAERKTEVSHEVAAAAADLEEIRRLRRELNATRADLDTLRNGVAWLGTELDRAKRWGALWKRAAKDGARDRRDLVAAYEDMRAENAAVRRAARQLVVALACAPRVQVVE